MLTLHLTRSGTPRTLRLAFASISCVLNANIIYVPRVSDEISEKPLYTFTYRVSLKLGV